jgi:N-acetylmuramoyl-L-alanine amidase
MNLSDLLTGAATIYGEARGSTQEDRVAVAHTILNRTKAKSWYGKAVSPHPDHSISAICLKPMQFSCWNKNDPLTSHSGAVCAPCLTL